LIRYSSVLGLGYVLGTKAGGAVTTKKKKKNKKKKKKKNIKGEERDFVGTTAP